jgi:hypothetical protein
VLGDVSDVAGARERIDDHSHLEQAMDSLNWDSLKADCAIRVVDFAGTFTGA